MISREFMSWLRAPALAKQSQKQQRTTKPGTIGAMTAAQFDKLLGSSLTKAMAGTQAKPQPVKNALRSALKARAAVQFKTVGIPPAEHSEALKMLLGMTPAERQKLMDQLAAVEQAAVEWGMTAGDVIDLIKG